MLTELVVLRGIAVHAGTETFASAIQSKSPADIAHQGGGAVAFVAETTRALRPAW
jgi:hypothetical protein